MRTRKTDSMPPAEDVTPIVDDTPLVLEGGSLAADDLEFLDRVARFLIGIQNPAYLKRPRREGYTPSEHQLGWRLWNKAAGADRPLDHWLAVPEEPSPEDDAALRLAHYRELDNFFRTWIPRSRALVERCIPDDAQEAFTATFFADLESQPFGPGIVGQVRAFLDRVAALAKSNERGAKDVAEKLVERGLTTDVTKSIRTMLAEADGEKKGKAKAQSGVSADELRKGHEAQLQAMKELKRWFNDWATMLKSVIAPRDQVRLGLTPAKARATSTPKPPVTASMPRNDVEERNRVDSEVMLAQEPADA
jgi:hypothetical protein